MSDVAQIVSRICGTCSIAHETACIEAIENGLGINPSEQTIELRNLLLNGLNIRDHAMHLFIFCLPDLYGKDSILDFPDSGKLHNLVHSAFDIKQAGNDLSAAIGGRAVHAPFPTIGGYLKLPSFEELKKISKQLEKVRDAAIDFVEIFHECEFFNEPCAEFVSLINDKFSYLGKELMSSEGESIPKEKFEQHLHEFVIPYSQAKGFEFEGKPYIVGALARVNINGKALNKRTKKDLSKFLKVFPSTNIFHNNLAQAIEIVNCIDFSREIIDSLDIKNEKPPTLHQLKKDVSGIGVIEAPRGTLYYNMKIAKDLKVKYTHVVIPTAQNQVSMDKEIGRLVQWCLDNNKNKKYIYHEIEKLIRAYDPCMSCATHFLKIKWI